MIVNSIRNGNGKQVVFTSMADVIANMADRKGRYRANGDDAWTGAQSLGHAVTMLRDGWTEGRQIVDGVIGSLESDLQQVAHDMVQDMVHDVAGAYPDMGLYMEGEPECMVQFVTADPDTTSGQVTRLLVDNGANAKHTAQWMTKRAGAIAALVHVLGMVGKSVEVWVASPVDIHGKMHDTVVRVHEAGTPVNIDSIAFALGHPAMLRRIMFECRYDDTLGYGWAGAHNGKHIQETLDYVQPHVVVGRVENEPKHIPNPVDAPLEWVRYQLAQLGLLETVDA